MFNTHSISDQEHSEKRHFDEMAKLYDTNYTYNTPFTQYKIHKKLALLFADYSKQEKISILEIGAGTGEYTQYLAELFPHASITAIDISPKILEVAAQKCRKYKNVTFKAVSAYDLPYKDKSFDMVCGFYILHHLDIDTTIREMYRVLKNGAAGLFYEPNLLNPVVLAIKSIPFLKHMAGDSRDEWAINAFELEDHITPFKQLEWKTSEFIAIPSFVPLKLAILFDQILTFIGSLPILNWYGGSVSLKFRKA